MGWEGMGEETIMLICKLFYFPFLRNISVREEKGKVSHFDI